MSYRITLVSTLTLLALLSSSALAAADPPNVVLIMADDLDRVAP